MINLLPKEIKERQKVKSALYSLTLLYVIILITAGLSLAALATYNLTQTVAINDRATQLGLLELKSKKDTELSEKAAFIEDRLNTESQHTSSHAWEDLLDKISINTPANIRLSSLRIAEEENAISLSIAGETADRRAIVLFRDKLASDSSFVDIVITTINEPTSAKNVLTFTITGKVKNAV